MQTITLRDGNAIPVLGFGTWQLKKNEVLSALPCALEVGYRHIDAAEIYGNQKEIGMVLEKRGIPRKEFFITSKVWWPRASHDEVLASCEETLRDLRTDYVDLLLIHWPNKDVPQKETLGALKELKDSGKTRAIGVSNYTIRRLQDALETGIPISLNQVEFHPSLNQKELLLFCKEQGIVITAYSPIAQGDDLRLPVILELAKKYKHTPAQIILNWIVAKGMITIPRSKTPERIQENFDSLSFTLAPEDIQAIDAIGGHHRIVDYEIGDFDY